MTQQKNYAGWSLEMFVSNDEWNAEPDSAEDQEFLAEYRAELARVLQEWYPGADVRISQCGSNRPKNHVLGPDGTSWEDEDEVIAHIENAYEVAFHKFCHPARA